MEPNYEMSGAIRVLHVVGAMNVGGAETMLMNLYRALDRSLVQFDFLVFGDEEGAYDHEVEDLGGRIIRVAVPRGRGLLAATADVRGVLRRHGPFAAVHAHVLHANAIALRAAAAEGIAIRIAHSHSTADRGGGLLRGLYTAWSRAAIRRHATQLVACGTQAAEYLFGSGREWVLLRNGVDLDRFRPASEESRIAARSDLDLPDGCVAIGSVARFEPVKNHEFLLELAARLKRDSVPFRLLLAGDGSRRAEIQDLVKVGQLDSCVAFLGLYDDVPGLLAALDGVAMPSHHEGIPVAMVEAQAMGVPCLVSAAVSGEADLGVGLVDFLPLDSLDPWVSAVRRLPDRRRCWGQEEGHDRLARAGLDQGLEVLYELYGVECAR